MAFAKASKSWTRVSQMLKKTFPTGAKRIPRELTSAWSTLSCGLIAWTVRDGEVVEAAGLASVAGDASAAGGAEAAG